MKFTSLIFAAGAAYAAYMASQVSASAFVEIPVADVAVPAQTFWIGCACAAAALVLLSSHEKRQPVEGSVFVTGCDSGMGEITAIHLNTVGFYVFAGIFVPASKDKLLKKIAEAGGDPARCFCLPLDVTKNESVDAAVASVQENLRERGDFLSAVVNCAGLGFSGPAEYFPEKLYEKQLQVNFFGYVRVFQKFFPIVREYTEKNPNGRRGRFVFIGTGGGVPSPSPALLSAYMASKWAVEAFCQSLRLELKLRDYRIDATMINPGYIKPTRLMEEGVKLLEMTWKMMPSKARDEYGDLLDKFMKFSEEQPGTHPIYIAKAIEEALNCASPKTRYKVGPDSKASPIVGILPTPAKEWIVNKSMYGK